MLVTCYEEVGDLSGVSCVSGLYLEFSVRGCNGRAGGSGERKTPSGVQGQGRGGSLGAKPPEAIGTMNINVPIKTGFCASSVCMLLLKHILKLKRHTVQLCNKTGSDGYFRDDVSSV